MSGLTSQWTEVRSDNIDETVAQLRDVLRGREVTLLETQSHDTDLRKGRPLTRRTLTVEGVALMGSPRERLISVIEDRMALPRLNFGVSARTPGFRRPFLSVFIDRRAAMVQFMMPTMTGQGLWIFMW
jgi:hypothetical protein